jgi:RimJ/RimL family protein N-acetyltransferase
VRDGSKVPRTANSPTRFFCGTRPNKKNLHQIKNFMSLILETNRLIMRELVPGDATAMFELDCNPAVMQYLGGQTMQTADEMIPVVDYIRRQYTENGIGRYAVILKETGEFIGWSGIKFVTEPENNFVNFYDLGYRFIEHFWGKGYGYEAALPWIDYAFDIMKINKLNADAHIHNVGSNRILQKLGFTFVNKYEHEGYPFNWYELKP